jgi:hypothetical protein
MLCQRCVLLENGTVSEIGETNHILNLYQKALLSGSEWKRLGTKQAYFVEYKSNNIEVGLGEDFIINLKVKKDNEIKDISFSIDIRNDRNEFVAHISNADDNFIPTFYDNDELEFNVTLKSVNFAPGNYMISLWAGTNFGENFDYIENSLPMRVVQNKCFIKRETPYDNRSTVVISSKWNKK